MNNESGKMKSNEYERQRRLSTPPAGTRSAGVAESARWVLSAFLALLCAGGAVAAATDVQVHASASPAQLTLADVFQYSIEITGAAAANAQPQPPDFEALGLQVLSGPRMQQSINIINNIPSVSASYSWTLRPAREGTFEIPPVPVVVGRGQTIQSNAVRITVAAAGTPPPSVSQDLQGEPVLSARSGNPNIDRQLEGRLFLRVVADKTEAYVGEPITLRYEWYQAADLPVVGYEFESRPAYKGFLTETLYQPPRGQLQFQSKLIGNTRFEVAPIEVVALFATKSGPTSIPAMSMIASLRVQSAGRRRSFFDDPFFDDFFDDPFGRRTIQARLTARPISFRILPLPTENRPAHFSGTVGEWTMTASLDRTEVRQYDLVALRIQFSGKGKADAISPPVLPTIPGLQRFKEQSSTEAANSASEAGGSKTFEFFLRATDAGDITIPPIEYAIFNPASKSYEILKSQPLALRVTPAPRSDQPMVQVFTPARTEAGEGGPSPVVELQRNIEYIQTTGFLSRPWLAQPLYTRAGFLLFQLIPIALVAISCAVRRRRDRLEGDVAWARRRSARSTAAKRLRQSRRYLSAAESARFFEELNRALRQFVADMLNQSAAGITAEQIAQALEARGASEQEIAEMLSLIEACESARYAAGAAGPGEMQQLYDRALELIDRLARRLNG